MQGLKTKGETKRREVFWKWVVGAAYLPGITGVPKSRFRYRPPHPMRVVDRLLLVGGQNGGGSVFENGAADAVYLLGSLGPETALPLSTSPSKAGGRWLAHDW